MDHAEVDQTEFHRLSTHIEYLAQLSDQLVFSVDLAIDGIAHRTLNHRPRHQQLGRKRIGFDLFPAARLPGLGVPKVHAHVPIDVDGAAGMQRQMGQFVRNRESLSEGRLVVIQPNDCSIALPVQHSRYIAAKPITNDENAEIPRYRLDWHRWISNVEGVE